jgi:membrane protease YdiL (CAAX protease family)
MTGFGLRSIGGSLVWSSSGDRIRTVWRVLIPVLAGLVTFPLSFVGAVILGAPLGIAALTGWLVTAPLVFVVVSQTARVLDRRRLSAYGFELGPDWFREAARGVAGGSLLVLIALGVSLGVGSVELPAGAILDGSASLLWLGLFLVGFVAVALWEELVFRGVVMTNLIEGARSLGYSRTIAQVTALLASATIFALVHVPGAVSEGHSAWLTVLWTGAAGLLFGLAHLLTGQLALPVGLHLGINYISGNVLGIAGIATMEGVPSLVALEAPTSGLWAPASGLPMILALLVACGVCLLWFARGQSRSTFPGRSRDTVAK